METGRIQCPMHVGVSCLSRGNCGTVRAHIIHHTWFLRPLPILTGPLTAIRSPNSISVCSDRGSQSCPTDRQEDRQTDRQTYRQTERQTDRVRQTDRKTDKQEDRQTDRQTDRVRQTDELRLQRHHAVCNNSPHIALLAVLRRRLIIYRNRVLSDAKQ